MCWFEMIEKRLFELEKIAAATPSPSMRCRRFRGNAAVNRLIRPQAVLTNPRTRFAILMRSSHRPNFGSLELKASDVEVLR